MFYNLEVSARALSGQSPSRLLRHADDLAEIQRRSASGSPAPAAALRREEGRPRAALHAEQPAVRDRATTRILRADAVVVPVNPMNLTEELRHYVRRTAAPRSRSSRRSCARAVAPLLGSRASSQHVIVAAYSRLPRRRRPICRCRSSLRAPRAAARRAGRHAVERRARRAACSPGPHDRRARRPVRDALHLRHHRPAQGLHAHAPHA